MTMRFMPSNAPWHVHLRFRLKLKPCRRTRDRNGSRVGELPNLKLATSYQLASRISAATVGDNQILLM